MKKRVVFIMLVFVLSISFISSADYYISNDGDNSWSGTLPEPNAGGDDGPWADINAFVSVVFVENLNPGDKVLFKKGGSWVWDLNFIQFLSGGNAENVIYIGAYGEGERPIIETIFEDGFLFYINDPAVSYITFDGLHLVGDSSLSKGFRIMGASNIIINDCEIEGFDYGIQITEDSFNCQVLNNNIHDNPTQGMIGGGINALIAGNTFSTNGHTCSQNPTFPAKYCHGLYFTGRDMIIEDNFFYESASFAIDSHDAVNIVIRNNIFYENGITNGTVGVYKNGGGIGIGSNQGKYPSQYLENVTIENNLFVNNTLSIVLAEAINFTIKNNIIIESKSQAISLGGNVSFPNINVKIFHNTLYNNKAQDIYIGGNNSDIDIKNNLIKKTNEEAIYFQNLPYMGEIKNLEMNNNLYDVGGTDVFVISGFDISTIYYTFSEWQALGYEANGLWAQDPLFINPLADEFYLQLGSPAIDAGVDVGVIYDFSENLRDALPDIGAYEYREFDCGNNTREPGEQCDGVDLNAQTCVSLGYDSGNLNCTAQCSFDTSNCVGSPCELTSAQWIPTNATEGDNVALLVTGTNCDGETLSFEVREDDTWPLPSAHVNIEPANTVFISGSVIVNWTAEWQSDWGTNPEFFFIATLVSYPSNEIDSRDYSSLLSVVQAPEYNHVVLTETFEVNISEHVHVNQTSVEDVLWDGVDGYRPTLTGGGALDVSSPGLVGLWRMNEIVNGNISDATGNGYTGVVNGNIITTTGVYGNALEFDGVGDYVTLPIIEVNPKDFSIGVWFKGTSIVGRNNIFHASLTGEADEIVDFRWDGSSTLFLLNDYNIFAYATSVTEDQWHFGVITVDDALQEAKLYIDEVPISNDTIFSMPDGNFGGGVFLGSRTGGGEFLNGSIDEVAIWNRVLDATEVAGLYDEASYSGTFESNVLYSGDIIGLNVSWSESGSGVNMQLSTDKGVNWCDVTNGELVNDVNCDFSPGHDLKYRVTFTADTELYSISFGISYEVENPAAVCGNNIVESGEDCDDGNTDDGDGCDSNCQDEGGGDDGGNGGGGSPGPREDPIIIELEGKDLTISGIIKKNNIDGNVCDSCDVEIEFNGDLISDVTDAEGNFEITFPNRNFDSGVHIIKVYIEKEGEIERKEYVKEIYLEAE